MTRFERLLPANRPMLRALTVGWVAITVVHFTIWAMIASISGHLDNPWWITISGGLGIPLAALWWLGGESRRT